MCRGPQEKSCPERSRLNFRGIKECREQRSSHSQLSGKGNEMKTLRSKRIASRVLGVLVLVLGLASPGPAAEGIWVKKADMPTARFMLGACAVDGKIYAIGGGPAPHQGISAVEEYDPGTDTWTTKAPMPTPRAGLDVSVVDGKIYAIGGAPLGGRTVEEYDPATDTWTRKADMPTARFLLSTSEVAGKIYAIGGGETTAGPAFTTVEEYDPATDTWARKADLPEPRFLHAAGVVDGKIYIIGGSWQAWTASAAVFVYDPASDTWERKTDAPTVRSWLSPTAAVVDGRIYVIGGDFGPPKANVEEYDPATDTWRQLPDMPTPRGGLSTTVLNGKIHVIGGITASVYDVVSTVEEYTPNPLVVDFNSDGIVDIKDLLRLIESWGQNDPVVDIAPRPSGDGVVDEKDLEILMSHWGEEPGLIARWKLDEASGTVAADSAAANDGTLIGEPLWMPTAGKMAGALQFDGLDDYVETPFVLDPSAGPFSVFAWVKGGAPGQVILSQEKGADWLMAAQDGGLKTGLKIAGRLGKPLTSSVVITDGAWHRIGLVWDGSSRILYVDVEVATDTQTSLAASAGALRIGAGATLAPGSFWSGLINDVRIYDRAVSP
jgi:N-acetylneuraminic acid mutarotase